MTVNSMSLLWATAILSLDSQGSPKQIFRSLGDTKHKKVKRNQHMNITCYLKLVKIEILLLPKYKVTYDV